MLKKTMAAIGCKAATVLGPRMLKLEAAKPKLLLVAGVACLVGGTAMACRATLKTSDRVVALHEELVEIEANGEPIDMVNPVGESMTISNEHEIAREKAIAFGRAALDISREFLPTAALTIGGIALCRKSYVVMDARIGGLVAAYAALEEGYSKYRKKVAETIGEDEERRLANGVEWMPEKENPEDGETVTIFEAVHPDGAPYSPYARYFDAFNSREYVKSKEENYRFLLIAQSIANELFERQGYLFLNDVYKQLGMEPTPTGQIVGWIKGPDEASKSQPRIDFGIFEARNAEARNFIDGSWDDIFVLDFNVDGIIWDLI